MERKMILLLGAPGSGKGTIGTFLAKEKAFTTLSTGNVIRKEIEEKTPLGLELAEANARGEFFSDEIAVEIGKKGISDIKGNITLDGFPRNLTQARLFDEHLEKIGGTLDLVIHLDCDQQSIISRLKDRRVCPNCGASFHLVNMKPKISGICDHCETHLIHRPDDEPETIKKRLATYQELTFPLVEHYRKKGILKTIDTNVSPMEMMLQAKRLLS